LQQIDRSKFSTFLKYIFVDFLASVAIAAQATGKDTVAGEERW
jgi:hypothetical protein